MNLKPSPWRLTPREKLTIKRLRRNGWDLRSVALLFDCTKQNCSYHTIKRLR